MIIFITGDSNHLLSEKLDRLSKVFWQKTVKKGQISRRLVHKQTRFDEIKNNLSGASLFAVKRLIILRDAVSQMLPTEQKKLLEFLKKDLLPKTTSLVLTELVPLPKLSTNPLLKYLKTSKKVKKVKVAIPAGVAAQTDLIARADQLGVVLTPATAGVLLTKIGSDYDRAILETEKLALFAAGRADKEISVDDINSTVEEELKSDIFKTIDALGRRDLSGGLTLLHRHLKQGAHPLYLLSMLRYQIKTLIQVAEAKKISPDPREIGKISGLSGFVVRKSLGQLDNYRQRDLKRIFSKLVDADEAIKTGRVEGPLALDLLTFALAR